jgi:hypothetical protein
VSPVTNSVWTARPRRTAGGGFADGDHELLSESLFALVLSESLLRRAGCTKRLPVGKQIIRAELVIR